jgi:hypothetical protein
VSAHDRRVAVDTPSPTEGYRSLPGSATPLPTRGQVRSWSRRPSPEPCTKLCGTKPRCRLIAAGRRTEFHAHLVVARVHSHDSASKCAEPSRLDRLPLSPPVANLEDAHDATARSSSDVRTESSARTRSAPQLQHA